jgi:ankyrin repeat protein
VLSLGHVEYLLSLGVYIVVTTPLHRAVTNGHEAMARLLLDRGVNKEATDHNGRTSVPNSQPASRAVVGLHGLPRKPGELFGLQKPTSGRAVTQGQVENFNFVNTRRHNSRGRRVALLHLPVPNHSSCISVVQTLIRLDNIDFEAGSAVGN